MRTLRAIVVTCVLAAAALGAAAETVTSHTEKTLAAKPGGRLRVEAAFQDVSVTVEPRADISVVVDLSVSSWPTDSKDYLAALQPQFLDQGSTWLIRSRTKDHFVFGWNNCRGTITVHMPPGMTVEADTGSGDVTVVGDTGGKDVSADTGSGDVHLEGVMKNAKADTGSGEIFLKGTAVDLSADTGSGGVSVEGTLATLKADTGSGDVRVRLDKPALSVHLDTGSGDVELLGGAADLYADTGSGGVRAEGLEGKATLSTGSGGVKARWTKLPAGATVRVEASSGDVNLAFPAQSAPGGTIDTSSGSIRCDFPGTRSERGDHLTLAGGTGAADLKVTTGSGDVAVTKSP